MTRSDTTVNLGEGRNVNGSDTTAKPVEVAAALRSLRVDSVWCGWRCGELSHAPLVSGGQQQTLWKALRHLQLT